MKFLVCIKGFHGSKLFLKDRHSDEVALHVEFDQHSYHTPKFFLENDGEAYWNFERAFVYEIPDEDNQSFLEQRSLKISCFRHSQGFYGMTSVDLHTVATGPTDHDLPLKDNNTEIGRLAFSVTMEEFTMVRAHFLFVRVNHLEPIVGHSRVRPFLRYGFHEAWRDHHQYKESVVLGDEESPQWTELPDLEFLASIPRLLSSSLDIHICHHGSLIDDRYARCTITFAKSAENLKDEGHEYQFSGKLHYHDATIEGKLTLHNIPKYVQMVAHSQIEKPLQTETGIHNADPLAPGFEQPHVPVFVVDDHTQAQHVSFNLPQIDSRLWKDLNEGVKSSPHKSDSPHEHSLSTSAFWKHMPSSSGYEQL